MGRGVVVCSMLALPLLMLAASITATVADAPGTLIRIDSGGLMDFKDKFGRQWVADQGFNSGLYGRLNITGPQTPFNNWPYQKSTRYFLYATSNCYSLPLGSGRYLIRFFFNPGPMTDAGDPVRTFSLAAHATTIETIQPVSPGKYEEVIVSYETNQVEACIVAPPSTLSAYVNSVEFLPIDTQAYTEKVDAAKLLYKYFRITCGDEGAFGDATNSTNKDAAHRLWLGETYGLSTDGSGFLLGGSTGCVPACKNVTAPKEKIKPSVNAGPEDFPTALYATARTTTGAAASGGEMSVTYTLRNVDASSLLLVVMHFAEIQDGVQAGQRVFSAFVNGVPIPDIKSHDMVATNGAFVAHSLSFTFNFSAPVGPSTDLTIQLKADAGSTYGPLISGFEVYKVVTRGPKTRQAELAGLRALRDSMEVGEEHCWFGDACGPQPWTGVTCEYNPATFDYTVTKMSLPWSGLTGTISSAVKFLPFLQSFNVTGNFLNGPIPAELTTLSSLTALSLSYNHLNGSIPLGLGSLKTLQSLYLQDNWLTGGVPADLLPPPPGITIDVSQNPDVCGTGDRPPCNEIGGASVSSINFVQPSGSSLTSTQIVWIVVASILATLLLAVLIVIVYVLITKRRHKTPDGNIALASTYSKSRQGEFIISPSHSVYGSTPAHSAQFAASPGQSIYRGDVAHIDGVYGRA